MLETAAHQTEASRYGNCITGGCTAIWKAKGDHHINHPKK